MTYKVIKRMILFIPAITVGLWEYVRHQFLMPYISMELGNWLTPVILLLVSITLLNRLFRMMETARAELERERTAKDQLESRELLARELHDGIAQSLFLLSVKVDKAERSAEATATPQFWSGIRKILHEMDRYVRQAISNLREVEPPHSSAQYSALLQRVEDITRDVYPQAGLDWDIQDKQLTALEQIELLACIREGLLNVRKHAQATEVNVKGERLPPGQGWRVIITDNGVGFDDHPLERKDHYGLQITRERSERLGWTFRFVRLNEQTTLEISKEVQA